METALKQYVEAMANLQTLKEEYDTDERDETNRSDHELYLDQSYMLDKMIAEARRILHQYKNRWEK